MNTKRYTLQAGVPVTVNTVGEYFHLIDASYELDIDFIVDGQIVSSATGMESGFFSRPRGGFTGLVLTSSVAQEVKIAAASGDGGYNRSIVSVVDGGQSRTLANKAFLQTIGCGAVAGTYSHAMLRNPDASTKKIVIEAVSFSCQNAASIAIGFRAAALATPGGAGVSKNSGGAASVALTSIENNAAYLMVGPMLSYSVVGGVVQTINFKEPIVIQPGAGLLIAVGKTNEQINVNFEYTEY